MRRSVLVVAALALVLPSCGQTPSEFRPLPAALGDLRGVALGFEGLLPLDEGIYSAWLNLDNGDVVGLGGFNVNDEGQPVRNGVVIERFPANQNLFSSVSVIVAIEPQGQVSPNPPASAILQGPFIDGIAALTVPAPLFLEDSSGSYRIFTPTDGPGTNEGSGAWAVDANGDPSLTLPPLNNVYVYEHFMVVNGEPITMARFRTTDTRDFLNPWSAAGPFPEVPGEDFLENAPGDFTFPLDLSGATLIVTLEPLFNDSILPTQLVVLSATLPAAVVGGETIQLTNQTDSFPTGVAVIY